MTDFLVRDRVIRTYLEGRSWDSNPEFLLVRQIVAGGHADLGACTHVYDYEWEVDPGHSNGGCGDLVFTDGAGNFAVVEVKFIDTARSGPTARVKRTKSRSQVSDQARTYADAIRRILGEDLLTVRAFSLTNERGLVEER